VKLLDGTLHDEYGTRNPSSRQRDVNGAVSARWLPDLGCRASSHPLYVCAC